jgi:hypothetical protein
VSRREDPTLDFATNWELANRFEASPYICPGCDRKLGYNARCACS